MWLQLKIHTSDKYVDVLSDALSDLGASAVTFIDNADEPIYEPDLGTTPFWQQTTVVGLFASDIDTESVIAQLRLKVGEDIALTWSSERLKDRVWEKAWMDHFDPIKFGENLWICPSWRAIPDPQGINILLDPGLAFGTGTHPTTALCLEALSRRSLNHTKVIDYGCGSGILAIASIKLGASNAWCIDNDPQALIATKENAKKNNVEKKCQLYMADAFSRLCSQHDSTVRADLLIANILAKPLTELAAYFSLLLNHGAEIMLSGILENQEQEIVQAYKPWFDITDVSKAEEWLCIEAKRRNSV
ncbi:MAG: 50S ribosomal protein L11 methyltransferase [Gammaproteobacteria bacterium]|nr:50S ribosomal protein L11 methyltransferase [Gammaproteobacteria bacterium]